MKLKYFIGVFILFFYSYAFAMPVEAPKLTTIDSSLQSMINATFGKDAPKMTAIIACESSAQQYQNAKPLISKTKDLGISQINSSNWQKAFELGLDIAFSTLDNLKMAKYILDTQGFHAWTTYQTPCYYRNLTRDV